MIFTTTTSSTFTDEFNELLEEINNNNTLEDDECQEILEEIKTMIKEQEKL